MALAEKVGAENQPFSLWMTDSHHTGSGCGWIWWGAHVTGNMPRIRSQLYADGNVYLEWSQ